MGSDFSQNACHSGTVAGKKGGVGSDKLRGFAVSKMRRRLVPSTEERALKGRLQAEKGNTKI